MKIVVIGGAGVFGSRLVTLLRRDGHEVQVAGRGPRADLRLDRAGDLSGLTGAGAVVDAAGPFHDYADPYRVARFCIANGIHYLDLADHAGFCTGIAELDDVAKAAGTFALSGVSSVPGMSSIVVAELARGLDAVDTIDMAILPGNRAPRGRSVVESILDQVGRPFLLTIDGQAAPVRSWSRPRTYDLGAGMRRSGWMIEVPDQRLFPALFGARTVTFRAGLELGAMNHGLAALSWLRGATGMGMPGWLVSAVMIAARVLTPFGSDRGGMVVAVTGRRGGRWITRVWRLRAAAGEGPFIPAVAARAILRDVSAIAAGARPALAELPLTADLAAAGDLAVEADQTEAVDIPIFAQVLGADFTALPVELQATHSNPGPRRWTGQARVVRGGGLVNTALAALFRFPRAGENLPVSVTKTATPAGETWVRDFAGNRFQSYLRPTSVGMIERFGPFSFLLGLYVADGALHFPVKRAWFLGLPLPRFALPGSVSREYVADGQFQFDVRLLAPLTGRLVVHYQGWLSRADQD